MAISFNVSARFQVPMYARPSICWAVGRNWNNFVAHGSRLFHCNDQPNLNRQHQVQGGNNRRRVVCTGIGNYLIHGC